MSCALIASLFLPDTAKATTYYVATTGIDSNPGTSTQPFRTIFEGVKRLNAGDTLYIKSGIYNEGINSGIQTIPTGTSWSNAPVIAAYPGETVILRPLYGTEGINLAHSYIQYVIFNGLILDAANMKFGISTTNGAHHIRFQNMEVKNAINSGVILSSGGQPTPANTYQEFINCHVHHNGSSSLDHAFYISTSHNLVKQSHIHHNASFGVHVYQANSEKRANHNVIVGNVIHDDSTKAATSAGILLSSGDGNMAYNNIVYNSKMGIHIHNNNPTNSKVYNNTLYKNYVGIEVTALSTGALVKNNIVYQNSYNIIENGVNTELESNLMTNPSFLDEANGDFRLQTGSLAIDQGVELEEVSRDFTSNTVRPQLNDFDIGAYEFVGSADLEDDITPPSTPTNVQFIGN